MAFGMRGLLILLILSLVMVLEAGARSIASIDSALPSPQKFQKQFQAAGSSTQRYSLPSSSKAISARGGAAKGGASDTVPILVSSFLTAGIMYPVDLMRALSMSSPGTPVVTLFSNFHRDFGVKGFFTQGLVPEVSRATWMRGLKFSLYPVIHQAVFKKPVKEGTPKTKAAAAAITAVPEVWSIMPLEVAKITLTMDRANRFKNSMPKAMAHIFKERGLSGLFTGYPGIQYRQMSWGVAYFTSIGTFRKHVNNVLTNNLHMDPSSNNYKLTSDLLSGFAAGVFGACFNTPGDTIRSVVQKRILFPSEATANLPNTFFGVGKEIINERGFTKLWSGFGFKAMHLGGGGALMAVLVPVVKRSLENNKANTGLRGGGSQTGGDLEQRESRT